MQFTAKDIVRYQNLCRRYFDTEVDEQTAIEELTALVWVVRLIYHPLSQAQLSNLRRYAIEAPDGTTSTTSRGDKSKMGTGNPEDQ